MKLLRPLFAVMSLLIIGSLVGCSNSPTKSADVSGDIRKSLDQANLSNVKVSQDRDMGVVTLTGDVPNDAEKARAESIAKSLAGTQVVSNQIAIRPEGAESDAKKIDSDLDKAIEKNLDAVLVQHKLNKDVSYDVKNGVVTLKGDVVSASRRTQVEKLATTVPNVKQVVNELQVKGQKASSTKS
ncbi:MAG TPA: BON domain-containing protein [Candidatus Dormibacteraeota bacterium]|nr:BON domain-containing protein [Candidatus Dormibacteraeota bacterium]